MQRELARLNAVLRAGLGDEALGERRALVRRQINKLRVASINDSPPRPEH
jgi:hypothetical protein